VLKELFPVEGMGEVQMVKEFFERWAQMTPQLQTSLDMMEHLSFDTLGENRNPHRAYHTMGIFHWVRAAQESPQSDLVVLDGGVVFPGVLPFFFVSFFCPSLPLFL
jgi:hypothetical protein